MKIKQSHGGQHQLFPPKAPLATLVFAFSVLSAAGTIHAIGTKVAESNVFEWWDDGIISQDEAEDILRLLEEGNDEEACTLAEIYAQEPCQDEEAKASDPPKINQKSSSGAPLAPHGYALWKGRIDTTGHIVSHREELQVTFYRYTLRLGSQELLSYKADRYEAHFGDISTKEFHSQIPTDTLWGMAAFFPIKDFYIGGLLDTSITSQVQVGYNSKQFSTAAMYWNTESNSSGMWQAHIGSLSFALWQQQHQSCPLVKIKFQYRETEKQAQKFNRKYRLSWNTTAYIHGSEVPEHARLSSSILTNKLWASQNISASIPSFINTKVSGNANISSSLESDTLKARFKIIAESGPRALHAQIAATCQDAANRCKEEDLSLKTTSHFGESESIILNAHAKTRLNRQKSTYAGFNTPRLETGFSYQEGPQKTFRVALILPKGTPSKGFILRNESEISFKPFNCTILVDFMQNNKKHLHPEKAVFMTKFTF